MSRDWSLVCEREGMKATVGAAPMAGYLVGKVIIRTIIKRHKNEPNRLLVRIKKNILGKK